MSVRPRVRANRFVAGLALAASLVTGCASWHVLRPLTGNNISVVCVTDSLNSNHLEILKNINVDVIDNVTVAGVNVLSTTLASTRK